MLSLRSHLLLCIAASVTGAAMAQEPCEEVKLLPRDGGFHDRFGIFVRIDGATRSIEKPPWRMSRRAARVLLQACFAAALAAAGRWGREIGP